MTRTFLAVQLIAAVVAGIAWIATPDQAATSLLAASTPGSAIASRVEPYRVRAFYNRPDLVSDEDLRAILDKVRPVFPRTATKSNFIEHAVRVWGMTATFADDAAWSGQEMVDYLTDHGKFATAWDRPVALLENRPNGISVNWGSEVGESVHHDHWLASLTEAGVPLDYPVFGPGRTNHTMADVLAEAVRDFDLDEREAEWTAMALGLWLPPTREWIGGRGRRFDFDMVAARLARGDCYSGVCAGTHRVYSLMVLVRLDDEFDILSDRGREVAWRYLEHTRDMITAAQWDDGRWASDWPAGEDSRINPSDEPLYKQVITTGHHLEWLSIAPVELHPPAEAIANAMKWIIATTKERTDEEVAGHYTFYSHIGAAVANWRSEHPADAWRRLE